MWKRSLKNQENLGLTFTEELKRCQQEQGVTELNALIGKLEDIFG